MGWRVALKTDLTSEDTAKMLLAVPRIKKKQSGRLHWQSNVRRRLVVDEKTFTRSPNSLTQMSSLKHRQHLHA